MAENKKASVQFKSNNETINLVGESNAQADDDAVRIPLNTAKSMDLYAVIWII